MRYVQICERCGRVFPREDAECPKCHFNKAEHEKEILAAQQKKKAFEDEDDFYTSESTEQSYTACDICPHPYCNAGGFCPLLD